MALVKAEDGFFFRSWIHENEKIAREFAKKISFVIHEMQNNELVKIENIVGEFLNIKKTRE